jgi:hypothetical protein
MVARFRTVPDLVEDLGYAGREGRLALNTRVNLAPRVVAIDERASSTLPPLGPAIFTAWVIAGAKRSTVILTPNVSCDERGSLAIRSS